MKISVDERLLASRVKKKIRYVRTEIFDVKLHVIALSIACKSSLRYQSAKAKETGRSRDSGLRSTCRTTRIGRVRKEKVSDRAVILAESCF